MGPFLLSAGLIGAMTQSEALPVESLDGLADELRPRAVLHGGGIQWQRQQDMGKDGAADYTPIDAGLKKDFAASMPSSGNDSQTIGPSESYELEIACGSGGCQQTVGDFLFHCHVASHYISGMWHFWRVYNTLQSMGTKSHLCGLITTLWARSTPASKDRCSGTIAMDPA